MSFSSLCICWKKLSVILCLNELIFAVLIIDGGQVILYHFLWVKFPIIICRIFQFPKNILVMFMYPRHVLYLKFILFQVEQFTSCRAAWTGDNGIDK